MMAFGGGAPAILLTQVSIVANHRGPERPEFLKSAQLLPGWREEFERSWNPAAQPWRWADLSWSWRLFRQSRSYRSVVTGYERFAIVFAFLQLLLRRRKVPHAMVYTHWNAPQSPLARLLRACEYRLLSRSVSRIVVQSFRQRDLYCTVWKIPAARLAYLPYYATLTVDSPTVQGDYVFAGGDYTRDYACLIEAVRGLPYRVVIAARLRVYFENLQIPGNVEIVTVGHEEFCRLMAGARVVVVPLKGGLLHSGGQQTYLNAMSLGKPVIVADDCGADEYIQSGVDGIVLPPGAPAELREAIRTLYQDRELAETMGRNAARKAMNFSHARYCDRLLEIVNEMLRSEYHAGGKH